MSKEKDKYVIKVPVFTSKIIVEKNELFGAITPKKMIDDLIAKLNAYAASPFPIIKTHKNKIIKRGIDKIEHFVRDYTVDSPLLLLKIQAHNTNLVDVYYQEDTTINKVGVNGKIGSEFNFIALYPHVELTDDFHTKHYWIMMVYEDPHRNGEELIGTARLVMDKVLGIPVRNVKLTEVLDALKKEEVTQELRLKFSTLSFNPISREPKFVSYFTHGTTKAEVEEVYQDIPYSQLEEIMKSAERIKQWVKINFRFRVRKREYKYIRTRTLKEDMDEAKAKIEKVVESVFNETCPLEENELDKIYDIDFIVSKLKPILLSYITNTDETTAVS